MTDGELIAQGLIYREGRVFCQECFNRRQRTWPPSSSSRQGVGDTILNQHVAAWCYHGMVGLEFLTHMPGRMVAIEDDEHMTCHLFSGLTCLIGDSTAQSMVSRVRDPRMTDIMHFFHIHGDDGAMTQKIHQVGIEQRGTTPIGSSLDDQRGAQG